MAYWNRKPKAERPDWPKLVQIRLSLEDARTLEPDIRIEDPEARVVDGGEHGVFVRCHNSASVTFAKRWTQDARRPLTPRPR